MGPDIHPDIARLSFLLGTWRGQGDGYYPTISAFSYQEEVRFWHVGKPFLAYAQRTWSLDEPVRPLHSETGYWRLPAPGRVEVVLAHPMGIVEVQEGTLESRRITLASASVARTATAKQVERIERDFQVDGDVLSYRFGMAAVGQPFQGHLEAELRLVRPIDAGPGSEAAGQE